MKWVCALALASLSVACGGTGSTTPQNGEQPASSAAATVEQPSTSAPAASGPAAPPARKAPAPAPVARDVTIPSGTTLSLDLATALTSETAKVEDPVRATLRQPVTVKGDTVLPVGTELAGTITEVERSGRVKGRARLAYRFTSLQHAGERYTIKTEAVAHEAESTKRADATKIGIGAGAGAAIGAILGGGDGAAKGAAIGGAAGTGTVLATRGKEVELAAGTNITATLAGPVTLRVKG